MDKKLYDITVRLRQLDKKYINSEKKEFHFRMLDEAQLMATLKVLYKMHQGNLFDIKDITLD